MKESIIGKKFGKLTVVDYCMDSESCPKVVCQCECGNYVSVFKNNLYSGRTKTCGCTKGHKGSDTPLYNRYHQMKLRGSDFESFEDYKSWIQDQGITEESGYSIRRIDTSKPFSRENCFIKFYD